MGAKKRSVTAPRTPPPDPSEADLPFKLGDQVLCRYSSYPYWPATIDRSHQPRAMGKYFRYSNRSSADPMLSFWCTFSNEDTGGWVRVNRIVRYHPSLAERIRLHEGHPYYEDQCEAIAAANRDFETLRPITTIPEVPSDFDDEEDEDDVENTEDGKEEEQRGREEGEDQSNDSHNSEKTPRRRKSTVPKSSDRKRRRKCTPVLNDRPRKRRNSGPVEEKLIDDNPVEHTDSRIKDLEAKLSAADSTIAKLKRSLRKKDQQIADMSGGKRPLRILVPPSPAAVDMKVPSEDGRRIRKISSKSFQDLLQEIKSGFDTFKTVVKRVDANRLELKKETEKVQPRFASLVTNVVESEKQAANSEEILCENLKSVLEGDIEVNALREHKAGVLIKGIGKQCREMPLISELCTAICSTWKAQVAVCTSNQEVSERREMDRESRPDVLMEKGQPSDELDDSGSKVIAGLGSEQKADMVSAGVDKGILDGNPSDNGSETSPKGRKSRAARNDRRGNGRTPSSAPKVKKKAEKVIDEFKAVKDDIEKERQLNVKDPSARGQDPYSTKPTSDEKFDQKGDGTPKSLESNESIHERDEDAMEVDSDLTTAEKQSDMLKSCIVKTSVGAKSGCVSIDEADEGKSEKKSSSVAGNLDKSDRPVETGMGTHPDEGETKMGQKASDMEQSGSPTGAEGHEEISKNGSRYGPPGANKTKKVTKRETANPRKRVTREARVSAIKQPRMTEAGSKSGGHDEGEEDITGNSRHVDDGMEPNKSTSAESPESRSGSKSKPRRSSGTQERGERDAEESEATPVKKTSEHVPNSEELTGLNGSHCRGKKRVKDRARKLMESNNYRLEKNRYGKGKIPTKGTITSSKIKQSGKRVDPRWAEKKGETGSSVSAPSQQSKLKARAELTSTGKTKGHSLKDERGSLSGPRDEGKLKPMEDENKKDRAVGRHSSGVTVKSETPRSVTMPADSGTSERGKSVLPAASTTVPTETSQAHEP